MSIPSLERHPVPESPQSFRERRWRSTVRNTRAAEAQDRDLADTRARLAALPPLPDLAAARAVLEVRMRLAERIDHAAATGNVAALRLLVEAFIARVEVWGAASPRLAGTNARIYYRDHPPEIRIRWRSEVEETEPDRE